MLVVVEMRNVWIRRRLVKGQYLSRLIRPTGRSMMVREKEKELEQTWPSKKRCLGNIIVLKINATRRRRGEAR